MEPKCYINMETRIEANREHCMHAMQRTSKLLAPWLLVPLHCQISQKVKVTVSTVKTHDDMTET